MKSVVNSVRNKAIGGPVSDDYRLKQALAAPYRTEADHLLASLLAKYSDPDPVAELARKYGLTRAQAQAMWDRIIGDDRKAEWPHVDAAGYVVTQRRPKI